MFLLAQRERGVGLYAPGLDILTGPEVAAIKAFDPDLAVVFNKRNRRYEIYDAGAPGGPKWQLVIRVPLRADGSVRPPDTRELETLYHARRRRSADAVVDEVIANNEKVESEWDQRLERFGAAAADDLKWIGSQFTPSVTWRDRTSQEARMKMREAIRSVA